MAILKVSSEIIRPRIPVDAYLNGKLWKDYDSLSEAVKDLHVSYQTVKFLIATGKELYTEEASVTLDIPLGCPYTIILSKDREGRNTTYIRDDRTGEIFS